MKNFKILSIISSVSVFVGILIFIWTDNAVGLRIAGTGVLVTFGIILIDVINY